MPRNLCLLSFAGFFFALFSLVGYSTRDVHAEEPIPAGEEAFTHANFKAEKLKYRLMVVDDYKQHTQDPEQARQAAIDFLTEYAYNAARTADKISEVELVKMGQEAISLGSADPVIQLYCARMMVNTPERKIGVEQFDKLSGPLAAAPYPKVYSRLCEQWRYAHSGQLGLQLNERAIHPEMITALVANFQDPIKEAIHRRFIWESLSFFFIHTSAKDKQRLTDALATAKGVDPWLYHMMAGEAISQAAMADYVSPYHKGGNKKQVLQATMQKAGEHYLAAWEVSHDLPEPAGEMIQVAMSGAAEQSARYWFDQAVAAHLDYDDAYNFYIRSLNPDWGGTHSQLWKFGLECRDTARFDTAVPAKMIQCLSAIDHDLHAQGEAWRKKGVYEACLRVFAGYEKHYLAQEDKDAVKSLNYYRSVHASVAVQAEQYDHARKLFELVGENLSRHGYEAVALPDRMYMDRSRVFGLTSSVGPVMQKLEQELADESLKDADDVKRALEVWEKAAKRSNEAEAVPYFDRLREQLVARSEQFNNDWRELLFDPASRNWRSDRYDHVWGENFIVENPRSMIMTQTRPGRTLELIHKGMFPAPFMLEVSLEALHENNAKTAAGIAIQKKGKDENAAGIYGWNQRMFYADQKRNRMGTYDLAQHPMGRDIPLEKVNKLRVKVWNGHFAYYINGTLYMQSAVENFEPDSEFILALVPHDNALSKFRFTNFRAKPIHYGPPISDQETPENRLAYYTEVLEGDPEEGDAYKARAKAHEELEKIDAALEDLANALKYGVGPDTSVVHDKMGRLYEKQEKYAEALKCYEETIAHAMPQHKNLFTNNMAWYLATCPADEIRDGEEALKLALAVHAADNKPSPYRYGTLAAAYAETGNFDEAVAWQEKAVPLYKPEDQAQAAERLELYRQKKPYRATSD